jgi:cytosine/adenosine deaminase-related metal-dependent hydrolase
METPYFKKLHHEIMRLGGLYNAHLHLCRSGTLDETEILLAAEGADQYSHLSIPKKHGLIPLIHASPAYDRENLRKRVGTYLQLMEDVGTTRADTLVDVTTDRVGLSALEELQRFKEERLKTLDLQIGAYTPMGFMDSEPERWRLVERAAETADFVGSLPERDAHELYPDHIGYEENCRRTLLLASRLDKPIHIHVDQKNDPQERGTEVLLSVISELGLTYPGPVPMVWLIHVISPSAYEEAHFNDLCAQMAERNIGVICCPSAAISMRQLRPMRTPTHNSIARVMEFLAAGVNVRIGSDNIDDITSPAGTPDLMHEIFVLTNAVRFYDIDIVAKIGAGQPLNDADRRKIKLHLERDAMEVEKAMSQSCASAVPRPRSSGA